MIRPVLRATAILSLTSPNSFCSFWSSSLKAASVNGSTKQLGAGISANSTALLAKAWAASRPSPAAMCMAMHCTTSALDDRQPFVSTPTMSAKSFKSVKDNDDTDWPKAYLSKGMGAAVWAKKMPGLTALGNHRLLWSGLQGVVGMIDQAL